MQIVLLAVGRCRHAGFRSAADDYMRRLRHYATLQEIEIKEERAARNSSTDQVVQKEGERLLQALPDTAFAIALDPVGQTCTSEALAKRLSHWGMKGQSRLSFIIGGAFGLSPDVQKRANWRLSLSAMTFPHELSRVILLEQLYRAFTILRGESYHK